MSGDGYNYGDYTSNRFANLDNWYKYAEAKYSKKPEEAANTAGAYVACNNIGNYLNGSNQYT